MPEKIVDLHQDLSAMAHQTREGDNRPHFGHRKDHHKLGNVFPITDYKKLDSNTPFGDKVLASDAQGLREGNVAVVLANTYCRPEGNFHELYPWHSDFYTGLFEERSDIIVPVFNGAQLTVALENPDKKTAAIRSVEGIYGWNEDLALVDRLWADGVRSLIPVHNNDSNIGTGHPTKENYGLTPIGKQLVKKAAERGFIIDLSHLSDKSSEDVLDITERVTDRPPIISHTGSRALVPDETRSTQDELAVEVARRGGLIGIMPAKWLVEPNPADATVASVVRMIDHYLDLFWDEGISNPEKRLAIGTDFCGMGTESVISGLETITKLGPTLRTAMKGNQYPDHIITGILSGNAITFLSQWLPKE